MKVLKKAAFVIILTFCAAGFVSAQNKSGKIKVLYKPRPSYTAEARKNLISGKVILRVEFKADDTIGEVSVVEDKTDDKMKEYGLTDEAIKATRGIKFLAATEDGVKVTQTKIVVMEFSQY